MGLYHYILETLICDSLDHKGVHFWVFIDTQLLHEDIPLRIVMELFPILIDEPVHRQVEDFKTSTTAYQSGVKFIATTANEIARQMNLLKLAIT